MRTRLTRLPPLQDDELGEEHEKVLVPFRAVGPLQNVSRAFVRHPRALAAYHVWARFVGSPENALNARDRELVMLRTTWKARGEYPFTRHKLYGLKVGLSTEEIEALKHPATSFAWSERDRALIDAADSLVTSFFIPDRQWERLTRHFSDEQIIEAIFACGHFCMTSMFLNSAGIELDEDIPADPDFELAR